MFRTVQVSRELFVRAALVGVFVALPGCLDWRPLCVALTRATLILSQFLGLAVLAIDDTTLRVAGVSIAIERACTMVQAAFALLPVIWVRANSRSLAVQLHQNLALSLAAGIGVSALAIVRLQIVLAAVSAGVPWWMAHDVLTGATYFTLFLLVSQRQVWLTGPRPAAGIFPDRPLVLAERGSA